MTRKIEFRVKCDIHDTDLRVVLFQNVIDKETNEVTYTANTFICRVDYGCSPDNYVLERVW